MRPNSIAELLWALKFNYNLKQPIHLNTFVLVDHLILKAEVSELNTDLLELHQIIQIQNLKSVCERLKAMLKNKNSKYSENKQLRDKAKLALQILKKLETNDSN